MTITVFNTSTVEPNLGRGLDMINSRWLGFVTVLSVIGYWWRAYKTKRALVELSAWQRADCGIERPDIPCACDLEAAARRQIAKGVHNYWC